MKQILPLSKLNCFLSVLQPPSPVSSPLRLFLSGRAARTKVPRVFSGRQSPGWSLGTRKRLHFCFRFHQLSLWLLPSCYAMPNFLSLKKLLAANIQVSNKMQCLTKLSRSISLADLNNSVYGCTWKYRQTASADFLVKPKYKAPMVSYNFGLWNIIKSRISGGIWKISKAKVRGDICLIVFW